ncbi:hypothetical protein [Roseovarius sp. E0-M6]|uniref:hypothetical protein n=1 Tax=Roseovarius sp. E0-M6 TaxID=3127118 RepID=UPI0030100070
MRKLIISTLASFVFVSAAHAADLCNRTGSTIRIANHYTAVALFFGGKSSFTGWFVLKNGQCKHIGADNGQQDIILTVQKEGMLWGWKTLRPSNYQVETRTKNASSGHWKMRPSNSFLCVPPDGTVQRNAKWIPRERANSTKCYGKNTLAKNLIALASWSTNYMPRMTVVLTPNGAFMQ